MRVLLICYVYPPEAAPAGVMIRELAEDLAARGHQVSVLSGWPNHPKGTLFPGWRSRFRHAERDPAGFRVVRCPHALRAQYRLVWKVWYYFTFAMGSFVAGLGCGPYDAVLSLSSPIFGSWSAWLLARLRGARFVYDIFDLHPEASRNAGLLSEGRVYRLWRRWDAALCRRSHAIATLSEPMKAQIVARGIDPAKVAVIPFWLDERRIRPSDRLNAWRRGQGIPDESFVALYAGTIGYISGAEILADVARLLAGRKDILILVVGEGPVKRALEVTAGERGLTNIRFLPFQPESCLNDVQATADVGLVSLLPEAGQTSVPSKVLGYMAAGRPVIASARSDSETAEMIREAECGLVTAPQDPEELAAAIMRVADDPAAAGRMGRNARRHLAAHYSRQASVDRYESLLVGQCRGSPLATRENWSVVPARETHLPQIARCHIEAFPNVFSSRMGPRFVQSMFASYLEDTGGRLFVAVAGGSGDVLGVTAGGRYGIREEFQSRATRRFALPILARALYDQVVRRAVGKRLRQLWRRTRHGSEDVDGSQPWRQDTAAWLQVICVRRAWRGCGVAAALMEAFLDACRDAGFQRAFLPVFRDNARAIAFYRKAGFATAEVQGTSLILQRDLREDR